MKTKSRKERVLYCRICGYIATSEEDLDFHISMSHEEGNSIFDSDITDEDVW